MAAREAVVKALLAGPKPWRTAFQALLPETQPFKGKHVISASQFDKDSIIYVLSVADIINHHLKTHDSIPLLTGKMLGNVFLEPSTRTATSFHTAMLKLGGGVVSVSEATSSVQKGETLEDTIRTLENFVDVIALRHPIMGAADLAARASTRVPIINAGDGGNEHPTQALLDLFCIEQEHGPINEAPLELTMLGDLKYGRTVHSLSQMVSHFPNIKLNLVSPDNLKMPQQYVLFNNSPPTFRLSSFSFLFFSRYLDMLKERGIQYQEMDQLEPVLETSDVIYHTRVQKERFTDLAEYERSKGRFIITPEIMNKGKKTMKLMHPFPRVDEISEAVDTDPRALYFKQPKYGLRLRMALMTLALGGEFNLPRYYLPRRLIRNSCFAH
ncbi:MAG: aspartate carbamoyltransferase catalytic subunit [archaeon]|nr:aspartate carbamoyltransferase catalytic subunit [archaeon]